MDMKRVEKIEVDYHKFRETCAEVVRLREINKGLLDKQFEYDQTIKQQQKQIEIYQKSLVSIASCEGILDIYDAQHKAKMTLMKPLEES